MHPPRNGGPGRSGEPSRRCARYDPAILPDHELPPSGPPASALPPVTARALAFGAIAVAGLCGGLIGYALVDLECDGDCGIAAGIGGLIGALVLSVGVGIVAILALRAMAEWRTIKDRDRDPPGIA